MKMIIICCTLFISCLVSKSQDVVSWKFTVKKIGDKKYELHFTPTVKEPWHIYSQTSPEDAAMPTSFSFDKNPLLNFEGTVKEVGNVTSKYEEVFGETLKYFEGKVDFVQQIKSKTKAKTNVSGTITFMACNNEKCTPPQKVEFSVKLE